MGDLSEVPASFTELAKKIRTTWVKNIALDQTFIRQFGWQCAALTPENIALLAENIAERIEASFESNPPDEESIGFLLDISAQVSALTYENFPSDPRSVMDSTMHLLTWASSMLPPSLANVDWEAAQNREYLPKSLARKLSGIELRIADLGPRTDSLQETIKTIEEARETADRLPTDMVELRKAREEIKGHLSNSTVDSAEVEKILINVQELLSTVKAHEKTADILVKKCDESYRITTSAGLAGAFNERSESLNRTGWIWVALLAIALIAGSWVGAWRFNQLMILVGDGSTAKTSVIILHFVGALMGVGAAIWIAWVSTKNIAQSFKLSEDYAFKASVSKAYEGYRREAVNLDDDFAKRLFGSALTRLDEPPSRFIEVKDHATPMEALLENKAFQDLIRSVPEAREWLTTFLADGKALLGVAAGAVGTSIGRSPQTSDGEGKTNNDPPKA